MKKTKQVKKRVKKTSNRYLTQTLYSYVEPTNGKYARSWGKRHFGSFSAYVNVLIAADRQKHFSKRYIEKTIALKAA